MAEGDLTIYNNFKTQVMEGVFDLGVGNDTIKLMLVSAYTPDIDNDAVYADVSGDEYGAGSGYSVGGETLANQAVTQDDANDRGKFDGDNVTWSSLGALSPATPSDAILYSVTGANSLILYVELDVTATNGGDYTIAWHGDGIILLT